MSRSIIAKYVTPWKYRREQAEQQRVAALRQRDGENCRRCRRPIRFDLPGGHDKAPLVETIFSAANAEPEALDSLCLTHVRCNAAGEDHTDEVTERIRRRSEAELLSRSRKRA
ncbi:MAG TPA: hypothetical protein VK192_07225 [Sphingomicrobium sp.]|jgi:hypothetical protein|nr:hypothetical protein [Sphingomicrobium sp.]